MQLLEVNCEVRRIYIYIYMSLGAKGLMSFVSLQHFSVYALPFPVLTPFDQFICVFLSNIFLWEHHFFLVYAFLI